MPDEAAYLADDLEWIVEAVADEAVALVNQFIEEFGPRPLFATKGTLLDQLQHYLKIRDDRLEWRAFIQQLAAVGKAAGVGPDAAIARAWREAIKMEQKLERYGGVEAVDRAVFIRDTLAAGRTLDQLERWARLPQITVLPPVRRLTPQEMAGER